MPVTVRCGKYKTFRETNPPDTTTTIVSSQLAENLPSKERKQSEINIDETKTHIATSIATIVDTKNWNWAWAATVEDIKTAGIYKESVEEYTTSELTEEMIPLNESSQDNQRYRGAQLVHDHEEEPPELEENTNKARNAEARMNRQGNHSNTDIDEHFKDRTNNNSSLKTNKTFESTSIKESNDTYGSSNSNEKLKKNNEIQTTTEDNEPLSLLDNIRKTKHRKEETTPHVAKALTELHQQSATTQYPITLDDKYNHTSVDAMLNTNETLSLVSAIGNKQQHSIRSKPKQATSRRATPANDTSEVHQQTDQSHDLPKHDETNDKHTTTHDVYSLGDHNGMETRPSLDPHSGFKGELTPETMSSNDTRQNNTLLVDANKENRPLRDPNKENRPLQDPNKENRPLQDPNKENRPLQDPNEENRPLRDPNKETRPLQDPNEENRPLRDPNKENRPLRDPTKKTDHCKIPTKKTDH